MINKILIHETICKELNETYKKKNADYGDSVGELYAKLGDITLLTRISDKYNRLMNLLDPKKEGEVNYESVDDTILDMANYCIIWLMERMIRHEEKMKLEKLSTLENKTSFDEGEIRIESIEKDTKEMFTNLKDYVLLKNGDINTVEDILKYFNKER